ncbi:MAG TPA: hypothetical protein VFL56_03370, partial [Solirubrobacterales bacterium]|nr:hypothetical protein [Solirubrobacterales bacterium]
MLISGSGNPLVPPGKERTMSDLTRKTRNALDTAAKATPGKDGLLSDPKKLGAAGIAVATLPVAVEQIAKRVAPKVSDIGEQAKDKLSDVSPDLGDAAGKVSSLGEGAKEVAKGAAVSKLKPEGPSGGGLLSKLKPGSSDQGGDEGRAAPG